MVCPKCGLNDEVENRVVFKLDPDGKSIYCFACSKRFYPPVTEKIPFNPALRQGNVHEAICSGCGKQFYRSNLCKSTSKPICETCRRKKGQEAAKANRIKRKNGKKASRKNTKSPVAEQRGGAWGAR